MFSKHLTFKILIPIIILLIGILIAINVLYIKAICTTKQCIVGNVSTILLLVWAVIFWFVALEIFKKGDKKQG